MREVVLHHVVVVLIVVLVAACGCGGGNKITESTVPKHTEPEETDEKEDKKSVGPDAETAGEWLQTAIKAAQEDGEDTLLQEVEGSAATTDSPGKADEWSYQFMGGSRGSATQIVIKNGKVTGTYQVEFEAAPDVEGLEQATWDPGKSDSNDAVRRAIEMYEEGSVGESELPPPKCDVSLVYYHKDMERFGLAQPTMLWMVDLRQAGDEFGNTFVLDSNDLRFLGRN